MAENKKVLPTVCPLDCPDTCGLLATVENGRVTGLAGDPGHAETQGMICAKMKRYPQRLYGDDRLLYPLLRTGKKGAGEFKRISWDAALDLAADRLGSICAKFGGEAVLPWSYAGNMGKVQRFAGYPFFHRLGALRLEMTICSATASAGWKAHCGSLPGTAPSVAKESDLIVVWATNVPVTNLHFSPCITAAQRRGAKLVVIDPCRTPPAAGADLHLAVRPGGDGPLALAAAKRLVEEGAEDEAFLGEHTEDFADFCDRLRRYREQDLLADAGITAAELDLFVRLLATRKRCFFRIGVGLTRNGRGAMSIRSITALAAILGLFDGSTGRGVLLSSGAFTADSEVLMRPSLLEGEPPKVNMIRLGEALTVREPKVRALFVYNANPAVVAPDAATVRKGLEREDLFTIVHEQVMTPTARYADLLLPATTFLENRDVYTAYGNHWLQVAAPVIDPVGEARSNFDLFQSLARRIGFTDSVFAETLEERLLACLQTMAGIPAGTDFAQVLAGERVLSERAGFVPAAEETVYRFRADIDGQPPFAVPMPGGDIDNPDLAARYPLVLLTPPVAGLLNSTFGERCRGETGRLLIHPQDAAKYQIQDGDAVTVENFRGSVVRRAKVGTTTRPGVVAAPGLYWQPPGEDGINAVVSGQESDFGGGALFHDSRVRISSTGG